MQVRLKMYFIAVWAIHPGEPELATTRRSKTAPQSDPASLTGERSRDNDSEAMRSMLR